MGCCISQEPLEVQAILCCTPSDKVKPVSQVTLATDTVSFVCILTFPCAGMVILSHWTEKEVKDVIVY